MILVYIQQNEEQRLNISNYKWFLCSTMCTRREGW